MDSDDGPSLNAVYRDRNLLAQLAAALAKRLGMRVGTGLDPQAPGWPLICIDLPTGQVSWHIPQGELAMHVEPYNGDWDGHLGEEKQRRILAFLAGEN